MKRISRNIRYLENKAIKGDVSASFQLFTNYENGEDVDANPDTAQYYFEQCEEALSFDETLSSAKPINKLSLESLDLYHFRKFLHLPILFEKDITVFIGDNGSGKTTILDAITRSFSWINARIVYQGRNGRTLDDSDITIGVKANAEVNAIFSLGERTKYKGSLVRPAKGIETAKNSKLEDYTSLANLFRMINVRKLQQSAKEINIPLLAFYSVERSNIKSNISFDLEKVSSEVSDSRFDAIDKSVLDGTGNISDFLKWFIYADNLSNSLELSRLSKVRDEIAALEKVAIDDTSTLYEILTAKRKEEKELNNKLLKSNAESNNAIIESVKKAITTAVPSVSDIFIDRSSGRAEVRLINENVNINFSQASKGQQVYISLIADIARRLISLNPSLSNRLNGQGIVLIDEVELHLHPDWQKNILKNLTSTFPNIQFIVSTHSPIVISGVQSRNIRILGKNSDGEYVASPPVAQSYARSPSEILYTIMHVDLSDRFPESSTLEKYRKIVEQGDYKSEKAQKMRKELMEVLGNSHEELIRLDMVIRRRELLG
ncbi:AAA family ATPase [Vibrio parahaemolyticus]|nr:AAA family ATPase [Vibrio parahaemolyticus]